MDMNDFQDLYASEAREHLDILNDALLTLENDPENIEMINECFRAAHTIKGMAGTMGFDDVSELSHVMENVLDLMRDNKIVVDTELINLLFKSVDTLEALSSDSEVEDSKLEAIINELKDYSEDGGKKPKQVNDGGNQAQQDELEQFKLNQAEMEMVSESSGQAMVIKVKLEPDCVFKSLRADMVFENLEDFGELIKSNPTIEKIRKEELDNIFYILFISEEEEEALQKGPLNNISEVQKTEITVIEDIKSLSDDKEEVEAESKSEDTTDKDSKSKAQSLSKRLKSSSKIKVDVSRLDSLMNLVAELVIKRTQVESVAEQYKLDELNKKLKPLSKVTSELQNAVMEMRMVPISLVFNRFPRLVRDLAQELEKDIELVIEGEDTELDRTIIDEIGDPLVHMIRNAIDHGIEDPATREKNDKSREGLVKLSAFHEGNNVIIQIKDDGGGIDPDVIRNKALEKGVVNATELESMSDKEIIEFIFAPGFSTNVEVSDVSGRGVGMDVVKNKIEALNGSVDIDSKLGEGTTFTIKLPLTLSIIQGFLTEVAGQKYVIPLESIQEIVDVDPKDIKTIRQEEVIHRRGSVIPMISLREKLNKDKIMDQSEELSTVIVEVGDEFYGLIVDSIIGQQEVVIKRINDLYDNLTKIAGGAILGDGSIALIINVEEITTG